MGIEEAAVFAIDQGKDLLADGIALLRKRRDLAVAALKTMPHVPFVAPQGAFYIFLDTRALLAKSSKIKDAFALSEHLLMKHHVAVVPGEPFGAPGYLRFSYATDEETIRTGLARIGKALSEI